MLSCSVLRDVNHAFIEGIALDHPKKGVEEHNKLLCVCVCVCMCECVSDREGGDETRFP